MPVSRPDPGHTPDAGPDAGPRAATPVTLGISLKMYLSHGRTLEWAREVAAVAASHPAVTGGHADLFALPSFPAIVPVSEILTGSRVRVGAQDIAVEDSGPYTGEVSGPVLRETGCAYAEVGHAERRQLFGEDDTVVAAKVASALRNGLTPVVCVGELNACAPEEAAEQTVTELARVLATAFHDGALAPVVVAYEPQWAIGAPESAGPEHITTVCGALSAWISERPELRGSRVIYGGSAGPGLLTRLDGAADGLFLGRFAHDTEAVKAILDEALALRQTPRRGSSLTS